MHSELDRLLNTLEPATTENLESRLRFGLACAQHVAHLLEDPDVLVCLQACSRIVEAQAPMSDLPALAARADGLANRHPGSRSLDGVGHAAVSATYACAKAIAGKARQAAEYAAYAAVYGEGGYGATSDPAAFEPEYEWQVRQLHGLLDLTAGPKNASLPNE
ncbi:MAG: hypothetical protein EOP80_15535 [Variovorax sp.]|jgi:hypothetical protein|nr:MAG: hypothetical protein EOP80_15535 [Variovorax sp.]